LLSDPVVMFHVFFFSLCYHAHRSLHSFLHDALPILECHLHTVEVRGSNPLAPTTCQVRRSGSSRWTKSSESSGREEDRERHSPRSEEHTSELQSPYDLVCRLLLEKKKHK